MSRRAVDLGPLPPLIPGPSPLSTGAKGAEFSEAVLFGGDGDGGGVAEARGADFDGGGAVGF